MLHFAVFEHTIFFITRVSNDGITVKKNDDETTAYKYQVDELPAEFPLYLLPFHIEGCQSRTCFKAYTDCYGNILFTDGWSNSAVMGGIIVSIMNIFNRTALFTGTII